MISKSGNVLPWTIKKTLRGFELCCFRARNSFTSQYIKIHICDFKMQEREINGASGLETEQLLKENM